MPSPTYPTVDTAGKRIPNPSRPFTEGYQTNTLIQTYDSGHEQRRKKGDTKMTWEFSYLILSNAAYETLKAFYLARGGTNESFLWTHPHTQVQYKVRFNMDTFSGENNEHSKAKGAWWKLGVKLIQVF